MLYHARGNVVAELLNLFADIAEKGIARPLTDDHDGINGYVVEIHCHCCTTADEVSANIICCET